MAGSLLTRRQVVARAAAAGGALLLAGGPLGLGGAQVAEAAGAGGGWGAEDYWRFIDGIAERLADRWVASQGAYVPVTDPYSTAVNAHMLTIHAVAAAAGRDGAARRDERARRLVQTLCRRGAPYRETGTAADRRDRMFHVPGWLSSLTNPRAFQDKAIDPKVAQALAAASGAGDVLGLSQAERATIAVRVDRCARGTFFRFPHVRLNQINWNCELYAIAAQLTGRHDLMREDFREHVLGFVEHATRSLDHRSPNLGPGYHFVYLPGAPLTHRYNFDSAEYGNETLQFIRLHAAALRAGMAPLPARAMGVLRAWVERALLGYWTHAGYLNWDTGLGFKRWNIGKVWGLALEGLLAIALSPEFHLDDRYGPWARWLFERGLGTYARFARESTDGSGLAPPILYGIRSSGGGSSSRTLFAARMAANAARALSWGLPAVPALEPPAFYAYDPDTGRLAVSTPVYATAVVPRNHRAFPYGGLEPARLHDRDMRVAATTGGAGPAAFGIRLWDARGRVVLDTQSGRTSAPRPAPSLEVAKLTARGSRGPFASASSQPYPRRPYAGTFSRLEARGTIQGGGAAVTTRHVFARDWIELRWAIADRVRSRRLLWEARFPSWGADALIAAHLRDGSVADLADVAVDLAHVSWLRVRGQESGYVVVPRTPGAGLIARLARAAPQPAAPHAGPALLLAATAPLPARGTVLVVRIAVATSESDAAPLAARLRR